MQYLNIFAVDLAKLINTVHERLIMSKANHRELLSTIEPEDAQPVVKVAFELFRNFVAHEIGQTRLSVLYIIKERIWPIMEQDERSELFSIIVRNFLSTP